MKNHSNDDMWIEHLADLVAFVRQHESNYGPDIELVIEGYFIGTNEPIHNSRRTIIEMQFGFLPDTAFQMTQLTDQRQAVTTKFHGE